MKQITLADLKLVFVQLLSGKNSRELTEDIVVEIDNKLEFDEFCCLQNEEEIIWSLISYLRGVASKNELDKYLHDQEDLELTFHSFFPFQTNSSK